MTTCHPILFTIVFLAWVILFEQRWVTSRERRRDGAKEKEMNAIDSATEPVAYVSAVLALYLDLPDTPFRASFQDRSVARGFHERHIPLRVVESALLLASLRRLIRPAETPALSPIRSLVYFLAVINELSAQIVPDNYSDYLRLKIRQISTQSTNLSAKVQKNTFSRDR